MEEKKDFWASVLLACFSPKDVRTGLSKSVSGTFGAIRKKMEADDERRRHPEGYSPKNKKYPSKRY